MRGRSVINRDILVLRETVGKLTQLLAGQGLVVTQRGTQAYVRTDVKTLKSIRVNIPHIADNASDDMIMAIQGFIDHEVGHILFTEFSLRVSIMDNPRLDSLDNIVEDTYVERAMSKKFPGSAYNLDRLHEFFIERVTKPALLDKGVKGTPVNEFKVLLVPIVRAWAGQKRFDEFLTAGGHWDHPLVKGFVDAVMREAPETIAKCKTIKNSVEALEVAQVFYDIMTPPPKPEEEPPEDEEEEEPEDKAGAPKSKPGESEKSDDPDGVGEAVEKPEDEEDKGSGGESEDESEEKEYDASSEEPAPEGEEAGESEDGEPDETPTPEAEPDDEPAGEDGADAADEPEPDGDEDDGVAGPSGEPEAEDEPADESEPDERSSDESADADEGVGESSPEDGEPSGVAPEDGPSEPSHESPFDEPVELSEKDTFEGGLGEEIGDAALEAMRATEYTIYTKDFDKVEPLEVDLSSYKDKWLTDLDDKTAHMVGPMQKDIERLMAARSQTLKIPGYRSGKMHGAGLFKLTTGDDRIFRRKLEIKAVETAVTLLIDCSGSMDGSKFETAIAAGYALSMTLDRIKVPHEVLGFTTTDGSKDYYKEIEVETKRIGDRFSRVEPLNMPIFKGWNERVNTTVKKRFAAAEDNISLRNNVDGESIEVATQRLLKRPERRKILIVLSDGEPAFYGSGGGGLAKRHCKHAVEMAEKMGVETIGIGIMDDAVKHYYPKHVVLKKLEDLPGAVMGELKKILIKV